MSHIYYIYAEVDYRRERALGTVRTPRATRRRPSLVRRLVDGVDGVDGVAGETTTRRTR